MRPPSVANRRIPAPRPASSGTSIGRLRAVVAAWLGLGALCRLQAGVAEAPLTNASQVLSLTQEQAARGLPIQLRGVVMGEVPIEGRAFIIWDGTECIYLRGTDPLIPTLRRGETVEVEGHSEPGGFAPDVVIRSLRRTGVGSLPESQPVTFEQMASGRLDSQWVRVYGIVHHGEPIVGDTGKWKLKLATGGQILTVHVNNDLDPAAYIDAEVSIEGFSLSQHNVSRQYLKPLLFVPRGVGLAIESAAPDDPFAAPVRPVATLLQFNRSARYGHRVHVRGVVTHQRPGEFVWIRDGERGLRVATSQSDRLRPGEWVDVLGFPTHGDYTASLEDAVFRTVPAAFAPPAPARLADMGAAIKHDADLAEIEGRLVEQRLTKDETTVIIAWNDSLIPVLPPRTIDAATLKSWVPGSLVRAVGICSVPKMEPGPPSGTWEPRSFELLLRSAADVMIVEPPPWWTHERVLGALGIATVASLLGVVTVMIAARRRLREQAARRAMAETEFTAILAERNRVAREIHDTLAQGLGAISVQLELAKGAANGADGVLARHLETAHGLVRGSLADARTSIWNMRAQVLENHDLAGALGAILRQFADGTKVETRLSVTGRPRRLPPVTENDLLRIGQEAITNAMKHASARHIDVAVHFGDRQVQLSVVDDGKGFDDARELRGAGCFGLVGIRERAAQMRGELAIESAPGKGTRIALSVPTPD